MTVRPPHPQNLTTTLPTVKMIVEVTSPSERSTSTLSDRNPLHSDILLTLQLDTLGYILYIYTHVYLKIYFKSIACDCVVLYWMFLSAHHHLEVRNERLNV